MSIQLLKNFRRRVVLNGLAACSTIGFYCTGKQTREHLLSILLIEEGGEPRISMPRTLGLDWHIGGKKDAMVDTDTPIKTVSYFFQDAFERIIDDVRWMDDVCSRATC